MTKRVALPFNHLFWFGIGDAPCQQSVKINLRDPYIIFFNLNRAFHKSIFKWTGGGNRICDHWGSAGGPASRCGNKGPKGDPCSRPTQCCGQPQHWSRRTRRSAGSCPACYPCPRCSPPHPPLLTFRHARFFLFIPYSPARGPSFDCPPSHSMLFGSRGGGAAGATRSKETAP